MRSDNLLVVAICLAAVWLAFAISWRGRNLAVVATREPVAPTAGTSALDALRTVAITTTAGFVAGGLVAGFGGRLVMRVLAATSGDGAQGRLTDAEELVGEITLGGTVALVIFVGLLIPVVTSFAFILMRRLLPSRAWVTGAVYGLLLLATFGVTDPLSRDNSDFLILEPVWLAVGLVCATAILFGTTFAAIVAKLDATLVPVAALRSSAPRRHKVAYASLVVLVIAPPLLAAVVVYVAARAVVHGRTSVLFQHRGLRVAAQVAVAVAVFAAGVVVVSTVADIV
jgi:hypothetical protein